MWSDQNLINVLNSGGVAVMPTDTIYGIVGRAEDEAVVEKIYKIKKRSKDKKLITLISGWEDIKRFGLDPKDFRIPEYTEPTSFILGDISFRLPLSPDLRGLLRQTGPLVAPSANPEGLPPAKNIEEAKSYFGDQVDLYVDGGDISGSASRLIQLNPDGSETVLRA